MSQAGLVELLFMFTYVNKCSSYKVIVSLQNTWTKLFEASK